MTSDNNNSELKQIYSQRGNVLILKHGFKYSKYGELQSGETGWKCVEKSCRAKLYTIDNNDKCIFSRETGTHIHKPLHENIIMRQEITNRLKKRTAEYLNEKPSKLVELELTNDRDALNKLTSNDIKLIKDNMYHARAKKKQNLPKKFSDNIADKYISTKNLSKINKSKQNTLQEYKDEDWPEWIAIEPHFLAADLL